MGLNIYLWEKPLQLTAMRIAESGGFKPEKGKDQYMPLLNWLQTNGYAILAEEITIGTGNHIVANKHLYSSMQPFATAIEICGYLPIKRISAAPGHGHRCHRRK